MARYVATAYDRYCESGPAEDVWEEVNRTLDRRLYEHMAQGVTVDRSVFLDTVRGYVDQILIDLGPPRSASIPPSPAPSPGPSGS